MLTSDSAFGAIDLGTHFRPSDEWDEWCKAAASTFEVATGDTAQAQKLYNKCTCNAGEYNIFNAWQAGEDVLQKFLDSSYVPPEAKPLTPPCTAGSAFFGGQGLEHPKSIVGHLQRGLPPHFTSNLEYAKKGEIWNYWRWGNEAVGAAKDFLVGLGLIPSSEPSVPGSAGAASASQEAHQAVPAGGRVYTGAGLSVPAGKDVTTIGSGGTRRFVQPEQAAAGMSPVALLAIGIGGFLLLRGALK